MKKFAYPLFIIGAISCLLGFALHITQWEYSPYCVTIGGTIMALVQINNRYTGDNLNIKRLMRKQTFGSILLVASGGCMLYFHNNEWLLVATIAAVLHLYPAIRIPQEEKKEQKNK